MCARVHLGLGSIPVCQDCTNFIFGEGEYTVQAAIRDRELRQVGAGDVVNSVAIHCDQDRVAFHRKRGCKSGLKGRMGHRVRMLLARRGSKVRWTVCLGAIYDSLD